MTYLFFLFMLVIAVLWHSCYPAVAAENCPVVPKADISALFQQWNQSLQTGQPAEVANHYADDAILLPTISSGVRHNPGEIEDYFQKFLAFHPDGRIEEENIQVYCDIAIIHGLGIKVVIEGVETNEQFVKLKQYNCDYIQGFLFSRPLPTAEFVCYYRSMKDL